MTTKRYELLMPLPSYSLDGINSRGYHAHEVAEIDDLHASGLAAAGYFDIGSPIEDKEVKVAPSVSLGGNAGLKPPFFDKDNQLQDGGLRPGAADLVGHEAQGVNDPNKTLDPDNGPRGTAGAVDPAGSKAAGDASGVGSGSKPGGPAIHTDVDIPDNWASLPVKDMILLADKLGADASNKADASAAIQAELDARAAAAKTGK